jgi:predicted flap endonuclease-1-like 5' DNA nuclease
MGKYLRDEAIGQAVDFYLNALPNVERDRVQQRYVEGLTKMTKEIAAQVEGLLAKIQALADVDDERRILLYGLLKQLPVVVFEPINYAFVGRVVIPVENVMDLLIHLDVYMGDQPVQKGTSPGVVELVSVTDVLESGAGQSTQGVIDIAGIGPIYSALLRERAGVRTTQDLLARGKTLQGRSELAEQTGLSERVLSRWVRRADLMRIEGVGEEYGELLEAGDVGSVAELARCEDEHLYQRLKLTNSERHLVQRLPSMAEVRDWIARAQVLLQEEKRNKI